MNNYSLLSFYFGHIDIFKYKYRDVLPGPVITNK